MEHLLDSFAFDNVSTRALPADPIEGPRRRQISRACYSRVRPTPVRCPELVAYTREVAATLGLSEQACESPEFVNAFTGNRVLDGMDPHATCYGGHQFGNWAGQLGDGRAINLGEVTTADGPLMLQLKGAGETPYSRTADGRAVLRSSVREFLCSEAMHHLGVPTTRALSLSLTGEAVVRDMLYDGHPAAEPGAVVCRVAPTFTRFGHFEILAARNEIDLLQQFTDHTIRQSFAELVPADGEINLAVYINWFRQVCDATLHMIVEWMRVGFVHGVMNTDNMSILGLTIDYGPYGWLDDYDPEWTPNTTDAAHRRYRFEAQPAIAQWNLLQLANAIYPLIGAAEPLKEALVGFEQNYQARWRQMMATKLGLSPADAEIDQALFAGLDAVLRLEEVDMTIFYRLLADFDGPNTDPAALYAGLEPAFYAFDAVSASSRHSWDQWLAAYTRRLRAQVIDPGERRSLMNRVNPKVVLRNYMAQLAIDQAHGGDFSLIHELHELLRTPYDEQPNAHVWAAKRPDWARSRVGCSQLSCSS